ncbi:MAG: hypothetical protein COA43_07260, partial [Robiginitomaculum sp.]
ALAQFSADHMALAASISVDFNNSDQFTGGVEYPYENIGAGGVDFTGTITGVVEYDIIDTSDASNAGLDEGDKSRLLARATVKGTYTTAFMGVLSSFATIPFEATSDVAYAASQGTPASVFFIVDNSGSMGYYDNNGVVKLTGLKASMNAFMDTMGHIDTNGDDIFRTALYPYSQDYQNNYSYIDNDGVIPAKVRHPEWGVLNHGAISAMNALHGTDSSGALKDAANAFTFENDIHNAMNGTEEPLKFAIFMTDGANNQSYECGTEWVSNPEYWVDTYHGWNTIYYSQQWWFDHWVIHHPASGGSNQQVCKTDYWFDKRSLATCAEMKDDGIKIYAIAYDVAANQKQHAEDFMQECSSGDNYFKSASNSSALDAAFAEIGESIVKEVIRVKR